MTDGDDEKRVMGDSTDCPAASLNLRTRRAASHVSTSLLLPFNRYLANYLKPLTIDVIRSFCLFAQ